MEEIKDIMERDRFCTETVGIELVDVKPGSASAKLTIDPKHLNGLSTVQGGAVFTLADFALAAAANAHGRAAVLINANICYFKAVSEGVLLAEAFEESLGRRLATYQVRITDEAANLIAQVQATVYRKSQELVNKAQ